jgi:hypothetical protein
VEELSPTPEVPVKELEAKEGAEKVVAEIEKDTVRDNKEMDVDMDEVEVEKEVDDGNPLPPIADDSIIVEYPPLPNTSSPMTSKPMDHHLSSSVDPIPDTEMGSSEYKKSGSSASTGSVVTLKRKVTSSSAPIVAIDIPLVKQLPPTPSSSNTPSPPLQQQQPLPPPPPLQHQSLTLKPPTSVVGDLKGVPQGATQDTGIPCIIASKRKRFKGISVKCKEKVELG